MGWKGALRSYQASMNRQLREERRRVRELVKAEKEELKRAEQAHAEHATALYQATIAMLTTVHRECGPHIDWKQVATQELPAEPSPTVSRTVLAEADLAGYHPGFFARLFGTAKKRTAQLQAAVDAARQLDARDTAEAQRQYTATCNEIRAGHELAQRVLKAEPAAFQDALEALDVFDELREVRAEILVEIPRPNVVRVELVVQERQVVPVEEASVTARGKLSLKNLPKTRGNEIYQDYVCGATLRACREVFAALPVTWVIATVSTDLLDASSGHVEQRPILSVMVPRETMQQLNFQTLDPSEAMAKFLCRMKFKKGSGLSPVDRFGLDDLPAERVAR